MSRPTPPDPQPTDPPFLLAMLLAGRKAGDRSLESMARDWLAEAGIYVKIGTPQAKRQERRRAAHA